MNLKHRFDHCCLTKMKEKKKKLLISLYYQQLKMNINFKEYCDMEIVKGFSSQNKIMQTQIFN